MPAWLDIFNIQCAKCNKPVETIGTREDFRTRKMELTICCHGEVEQYYLDEADLVSAISITVTRPAFA